MVSIFYEIINLEKDFYKKKKCLLQLNFLISCKEDKTLKLENCNEMKTR